MASVLTAKVELETPLTDVGFTYNIWYCAPYNGYDACYVDIIDDTGKVVSTEQIRIPWPQEDDVKTQKDIKLYDDIKLEVEIPEVMQSISANPNDIYVIAQDTTDRIKNLTIQKIEVK